MFHQIYEPRTNVPVVNKCNTNADTCYLGNNFMILNHARWTDDLYPHDTSTKMVKNVHIVSPVTEYDDPVMNMTATIIMNEGLYYSERPNNSIINPNQVKKIEFTFGKIHMTIIVSYVLS